MAVGHLPAMPPASTAPAGAASAAPSPKLVHAAHEFEAQMMKELLAPMTGADSDMDPLFAEQDDGEDSGLGLGSGSGSSGALAGFASQALGQALSERGGFGIANQIIRELAPAAGRQAGAPANAKVTGFSHRNTQVRSNK
jgi:Rod binding domain-containing protein